MHRRPAHLDARGHARMVDVGAKPVTAREAVVTGRIRMDPATLEAILAGRVPKGDVLAVARIAGLQAAKRTSDLLPLCHPVPLTAVEVDVAPAGTDALEVRAVVRARWRTGVEMEALVAAAAALMAVYDMAKSLDRGMVIEGLRLREKRGGRSGEWTAPDEG